ncbi:unnamed protein product, partial [marine sediment metagenome]
NINTTQDARTAFAVLLKKAYLTTTKVFICPSSFDEVPRFDFPRDFRNADLNELILGDDQCSYGWDPTKRNSANANCALIADRPPGYVSTVFKGTARNN